MPYTIFMLIFLLAIGPASALDVGDYGTVTLSKEKDIPTPFCPATKISDNDKCMTCHVLKSNEDGSVDFTIKPPKLEDFYSDFPYDVEIIPYNGARALYYVNTSTKASSIRNIAEFMYKHPEFKTFVMEMDSFGGSVMDAWRAVGILEEMRTKGIEIVTICYGKIASAGVILFVAGDNGKRYLNKHAEVMIHKVWTFAMFDLKNPDTSQDQADLLKHLQDNINDFLVDRTKLTHEIIEKECFKRDWWMTGEKAHEYGIANHLIN